MVVGIIHPPANSVNLCIRCLVTERKIDKFIKKYYNMYAAKFYFKD